MHKETVMGKDEMLTCSLVSKYPLRDIEDVIKETSIHQAKITWEARDNEIKEAEQRGIQKVVDWGNEKCMRHGHAFRHKGELCSSTYRRECTICWQAFLKEQGVE